MQSQAQDPTSLFRSIFLAGAAALLTTLAALPLHAQNSVPPTAVQAARMPQFAAKLAHGASRVTHPAQPRASYKNPAGAFARTNRGWMPPGDNDLYDNGPTNGTTDAWTINFGFTVSDSFTVNAANASGLTFAAWLSPGDTLQSVEVQIGTSPFGNDLFDQTVNFTQSGCISNQYGFNICNESGNFNLNVSLRDGTYWVTLQNASVNTGDPIYWDENSGPSSADDSTVGTIPSESFTVLGAEGGCPPEQRSRAESKAITVPPSPTQSYRVIYNFTGGADGGAPSTGLVIDAAGNLYGTTASGGPSGGGTVFKLAPGDSGWRFNRLYSFTGANGSQPNTTLVRDPDGRLYGTTNGGGVGNGVLFGLSPAGNILPTPFSNWMESLLYDFTGGNDGASPGGSLALDGSGNIYGTAVTGGVNGGGTLYEFTNGGLQVLHSFPAFQGDGVGPTGVVRTVDGLYGITVSGTDPDSIGTLYTTAGGYHVLEEVAGGPGQMDSVAADQAGNVFYTFSSMGGDCQYGGLVEVDEFSSGRDMSLVQFGDLPELTSWVSTDASGNVYGTVDNLGGYGNVYKLTCCWNYTDLHDFAGGPDDGANPQASPVVDAQGNIYGTAASGGRYGHGVVWEITP